MSKNLTIVGLGEILWDVFPDGARFGGAPANFACSTAEIGGDRCEVYVVSAVGKDDLGQQALVALDEHGVKTTHVSRSNHPTGRVLVSLDDSGVATYEFEPNAAWDNLNWSDDLAELAARTDVVCFGSLGQRSEATRETIQRFLDHTPTATWRIFDINLRPPFFRADSIHTSLMLANVLKLNEEELTYLTELDGLSGGTIENLHAIAEQYRLRAIALTRGPDGAILVREDQVSEHAGFPTNVIDTVGAGDAFTSAFALGLLNGDDLDSINRHAGKAASFVCSQPGATPTFPHDLIAQ